MSKRIVPGYKMWDSTSLGATNTSNSTNVQNLDKASIFVEWTGSSPSGTITVEVRNSSSGTWYALDFGSAITVSGASGTHSIILNELLFVDMRLVYTRTSGSGTINATIASKTVGA